MFDFQHPQPYKIPTFERITVKGVSHLVSPSGEGVEIYNGPFTEKFLSSYIQPIAPEGWLKRSVRKGLDKNTKPVSSLLASRDIQRILNRPVDHLLFEDLDKYVPANPQSLVNQARRYKIATRVKYTFPRYDCGNFAFAAMGAWNFEIAYAEMAAFIVWVMYTHKRKRFAHALNGFCTISDFYLFEPQNYKVFLIPKDYRIWVLIG